MANCCFGGICSKYKDSIKCKYDYTWCPEYKEIRNRINKTQYDLAMEQIKEKRQSTKGLDTFADTPEREGAEL